MLYTGKKRVSSTQGLQLRLHQNYSKGQTKYLNLHSNCQNITTKIPNSQEKGRFITTDELKLYQYPGQDKKPVYGR